jgi:hypothetical protein
VAVADPSVIDSWGSTPDERGEPYPCDDQVDGPIRLLFRAVSVETPTEMVFRWLCQLRVAPYSYDLIDNFGRRSPRTLTPGLDQLEVGQRFMGIFALVHYDTGRSITLDSTTRALGRVVVSYQVTADGAAASRLVAKLVVPRGSGRWTALKDRILAAGDLVMMRKQLLTLKHLAEAGAPLSEASPDSR